MNHTAPAALLSAALAFSSPATAQEPAPAAPATELAFRDLSEVARLRVVCDQRHYARLVDLVVDVPTGRVRSAVLAMPSDDGKDLLLETAFSNLTFVTQDNLFRMASCPADDGGPHAQQTISFDPARVKVARVRADDGAEAVTGSVLATQLARGAARFADGAAGSRQGLTLELATGHVAFLHVAKGAERAGDRGLHPTPWTALAFDLDEQQRLALALPLDAAALRETPSLGDVILQDPLYRPAVYKAFRLPPPDYDRG